MKDAKNNVIILYSVFLFAIGIIGLLVREDLYKFLNLRPTVVLIFSVVSILMGLSFFLMLYVKGGIFPFIEKDNDIAIGSTEKILEKRFENLKAELISKLSSFQNLEEIKKEIKIIIDQQVSNLSEEKIIQQVSDRFNQELLNKSKLDVIDNELISIKDRIERETARISRYGYINLMIGFFTTFLAIFFLGYSLLGVQTQNISTLDYIYHFIPRLSLSILIEFFAFFFLKLYKRNLEDIKRLFKFHLEIRLTINRIMDNWIKAIPDSGNRS